MGFNVGKIASVAGAAIGGYFGGPIGAAAGSNAGSFIGPSEQRLANREALSWYNRQLQDNITLWNMQNAYNSPVQQMNRLREAGLNPMLVYGSGSVDGNSASVPSGASAPRVQSSRKGDNSWIEKFFLNKSMENAQDQSIKNDLQEQYLALRNQHIIDKEKRDKAMYVLKYKLATKALNSPDYVKNAGKFGQFINAFKYLTSDDGDDYYDVDSVPYQARLGERIFE